MEKCLVYFVFVIVNIIVITLPTNIILADSIENQEINFQVIPDWSIFDITNMRP